MAFFPQIVRLSLTILTLFLASCGGGGGGGGSSNTTTTGSSGQTPTTAKANITQDNLSDFVGAYLSFVQLNNEFFNGFVNPHGIPNFSATLDGSTNETCAFGGDYSAEVSSQGAEIQISFNQCFLEENTESNGSIHLATSNANANGSYQQTFTFQSLEVAVSGKREILDGQSVINIKKDDANNRHILITANLEVASDAIG